MEMEEERERERSTGKWVPALNNILASAFRAARCFVLYLNNWYGMMLRQQIEPTISQLPTVCSWSKHSSQPVSQFDPTCLFQATTKRDLCCLAPLYHESLFVCLHTLLCLVQLWRWTRLLQHGYQVLLRRLQTLSQQLLLLLLLLGGYCYLLRRSRWLCCSSSCARTLLLLLWCLLNWLVQLIIALFKLLLLCLLVLVLLACWTADWLLHWAWGLRWGILSVNLLQNCHQWVLLGRRYWRGGWWLLWCRL